MRLLPLKNLAVLHSPYDELHWLTFAWLCLALNLHCATEPSTFGIWTIKVRANRDRRKIDLCEDYKFCCAYALDSLQSLFIDNQEVAAQIHKYPGNTYSPADKCWHRVLLLGGDSYWSHKLQQTCLSNTLKGIFSAKCLVSGIGCRKWSLWPRPPCGLPGLPCHVRKEQFRVVATVKPLPLSGWPRELAFDWPPAQQIRGLVWGSCDQHPLIGSFPMGCHRCSCLAGCIAGYIFCL